MTHDPLTLLEKLTQPTKDLLSDVEARVGRPINLIVRDLYRPELGGQTEIETDGTPKITLNSTKPFQEELLVHELLHVVLRKDGYPKYLMSNDSQLPDEVDREEFGDVMTEINEAVLHSIIYPRMENMGLRPRTAMRPLFEDAIKMKELDTYNEEQAAALYARVLLECDSEKLCSAFHRRYENNSSQSRIEKGRAIAEMIASCQDRSPQGAVGLFIRCCNSLFSGRLLFQERSRGEQVRGSHTDKTVTLYIWPVGN
jgi:hypothetical protein